MSTADYSVAAVAQPLVSDGIDLGLTLPDGFDLSPLLPQDRLLHLHPNWFVSNVLEDGNSFSVDIKDYATEEEFILNGSFVFNDGDNELLAIHLNAPLDVTITLLNINRQLYVRIISPMGELDPSDPLLLWVRAIREYIRLYTKTSPLTLLFRAMMNRMILQMNPSQRKICLMLVRLTIVEILVILFIVVGYVIFVL